MQERKGLRVVFALLCGIAKRVAQMLAVLFLVIGIARACQASYHFFYEVFGSVSVADEAVADVDFQVKNSDTMYSVSQELYASGLIANPYSFYVRTRLMDQEQVRLQPGSYVLNASMDYEEIIDKLTISE